MTDYRELVKKLRDLHRDPRPASAVWLFDNQIALYDAADAIEALQAKLSEADAKADYWFGEAQREWERSCRLLPKRGEWVLTNEEIETIRIHMNAIKEQLCNQYRHREAETYQTIVDKLAKMEVQDG